MESKNITLVNLNLYAKGIGRRSTEFNAFPLGTASLTACLEEEGFGVDFRDYQNELNSRKLFELDYFNSFLRNSSEVIGMGFSSEALPFVLISAKKLKEKNPEKKIILGGPGVGGVEEKLIESFPFIDVVVRGEAERTIVELVEAIKKEKDLSEVRGISFRKRNKAIRNKDRPRITDWSEVPFPYPEKIKVRDYCTTGVITSVGCPFNCIFCSAKPFLGEGISFKSKERVVEEIKFVLGHSRKKYFGVSDLNFLSNRKRVIDLCREMRREGVNGEFLFSSSIDLIDEGLAKELQSAGAKTAYFGVESCSNKILKRIGKNYERKSIEKVLKMSSNYFNVWSSFIYGFPFESVREFKKNIFFMEYFNQLNPKIKLDMHLACPFPNTMLYKMHSNEMSFSPELPSDIINSFLVNCRYGKELETRKKMIQLIKAHPDIFSGFYYFKKARLKEKNHIITEMKGRK